MPAAVSGFMPHSIGWRFSKKTSSGAPGSLPAGGLGRLLRRRRSIGRYGLLKKTPAKAIQFLNVYGLLR
jgi:hypothetical protein